ncbi:Mucin-19 [Plecturocebus cupreus]
MEKCFFSDLVVGATTGALGSKTGTAGVPSATTVGPGSSNSEATTSLGENGKTRAQIITGTTEGISGKVLEPGSAHTEATTFPGGSGNTQAGPPGGTTGELTRMTIVSGSSNTEATTATEGTGTSGTGFKTAGIIAVPREQPQLLLEQAERLGLDPLQESLPEHQEVRQAQLECPLRQQLPLGALSQILLIFALTDTVFPSFAEATTSLGESGKTRAEIITGTTEGKTLSAGSAHTEATTFLGGSRTTRAGPPEEPTVSTEETGTSRTSFKTVGITSTPGREAGTSGVAPGTIVAPGRFSTGATTGAPGSQTGTAGVPSATTVAPGSSNSETTTSVGESGITRAEIVTGITEGTSGKTLEAGGAHTEATTFSGGSGTTRAGPPGEATTSIEETGTSGTGFKTAGITAAPGKQAGTSGVAPGTIVAPGSFSTAATTSPGASGVTGTGPIAGATTGAPGSKTDNLEKAFDMTFNLGKNNQSRHISPYINLGLTKARGTAGVLSATTVAPGSSNSGSLTTAPGSQLSSSQTGASAGISHTTVAPGSSVIEAKASLEAIRVTVVKSVRTRGLREATTSTEVSRTPVVGWKTGATTRGSANQGTGSTIGISGGQVTSAQLVEMGFHHVGQAGLELLASSDVPTLASQSAEITEATSGTSEKQNPGSEIGTTDIVSGTTVASGSSNTVTTGITTGTTIVPGSSNTKATTSTDVGATTGVGIATVSSKEASDTNTAPGPPTTVTASTGVKETSGTGVQTETTVVTTKEQETENKTEPRTCLFNNTDYEIGASFDDPSNPCVSYSCKDTGFAAVVQDCPKQTWCAEVLGHPVSRPKKDIYIDTGFLMFPKSGTWMNLETIILSKLTQKQKTKHHMFSLIDREIPGRGATRVTSVTLLADAAVLPSCFAGAPARRFLVQSIQDGRAQVVPSPQGKQQLEALRTESFTASTANPERSGSMGKGRPPKEN